MKKDITNRDDIQLLVNTFYQKVRDDQRIGYLFDDVAQVDWQKHLPIMYDFWETNLLFVQKYKGNPIQTHMEVDDTENLEQKHFGYWMEHWFSTVDELFEGEKATLAKERARKMAHTIFMRVYMKRYTTDGQKNS
ncbi:group III truncated hemoglobin [Limibacter armeniacum]|uniref:group III truncated hemoglobin n=1 Tax=Limibacter armeniacum TaxID=466084 RepID=UPI002FE4FBAB